MLKKTVLMLSFILITCVQVKSQYKLDSIFDFKQFQPNSTSVYIRSVGIVEDTIWVCVFYNFKKSVFYKSIDKGKNFKPILETDKIITFGTIYKGKPFYLTPDSGYFYTNNENNLEFFKFPEKFGRYYSVHNNNSLNTILILTNDNLMLSTNLSDWANIMPPMDKFFDLNKIHINLMNACVLNDSTIYLLASYWIELNKTRTGINITTGTFIFKTSDYGKNWQQISSINDSLAHPTQITALDERNIILGGYGNNYRNEIPKPFRYELILTSNDEGKNWSYKIKDSSKTTYYITGLQSFNKKNVFAYGHRNIYTSQDFGNHWDFVSFYDNFKDIISCAHIIDEHNVYFGTELEGKLIKFNIITCVEDFIDNQTVDIFPNPATESINLKFKNIENHKIEIFNLSGNTIHSFNVIYPSLINNQLQVDISNLESGIYFVKIGTVFRKFLKI